jgi:hypothetical protein
LEQAGAPEAHCRPAKGSALKTPLLASTAVTLARSALAIVSQADIMLGVCD